MKFSPTTPFAERLVEALISAGLDQQATAIAISERRGKIIKGQTVQYATSKANSSELTPDIAAITGYRFEYLAYGVEPKQQLAGNIIAGSPTETVLLGPPPRSLEFKISKSGNYPVPRLDVRASMGNGMDIREIVEVIEFVNINVPELCRARGVDISAPENLRIVTGFGSSMRPLYDHLDPLLVDVGVNDLKVDDVYCLENEDQLYIKRVQRVPGKKNTYMMMSDNKAFKDFEIKDPARSGFKVLARVVIAMNLVKV